MQKPAAGDGERAKRNSDSGESVASRMAFVCPTCDQRLTRDGLTQSYWCSHCEARWNEVDGIPVFCTEQYYWHGFSRDFLRQLTNDINGYGWDSGILRRFVDSPDPSLEDYVDAPNRADWFFFLEAPKKPVVLDIGSGFGSIAVGIAPLADTVIALDTNVEFAKVVEGRARSEGAANVLPVVANPLGRGNLPFTAGAFDLIVLNGVLEWVGLADKSRRVREVQARALKTVKRLLRPGGVLYIGIENRTSWSNLTGAPSHLGIPFLDLMPRSLSDWVCRRRGHPEGFRTHTYTPWGYKSLLSEAGFADVRFLHLFPTYRDPRIICWVDDRTAVRHLCGLVNSSAKRMGMNILRLLHLEHALVYSLGIVAKAT